MTDRIDEMVARLNEAAWEASKPIEHAPELVKEGMRVSRDEARREIDRNDNHHANVILNQFGQDWQDVLHYDLVLNTRRLSIDACVAQICNLAHCADYQPTKSSIQLLKDRLVEADTSRRIDQPISVGVKR